MANQELARPAQWGLPLVGRGFRLASQAIVVKTEHEMRAEYPWSATNRRCSLPLSFVNIVQRKGCLEFAVSLQETPYRRICAERSVGLKVAHSRPPLVSVFLPFRGWLTYASRCNL